MFSKHLFFQCIICFLLTNFSIAQNEIIPKEKKQHSPKKASIYSAVLPGLGQAYNKKYWKMPIIYGAFGTLGYLIADNNKQYKTYRLAYRYRTDGNSFTTDGFEGIYTDENLKLLRDHYRRNVELLSIITFAVYAINIIDASVDAHLFEFDVSDDVSLSIEPSILPLGPAQYTNGVTLTLRF
jgi:hypothetical protein